MNAYSTLLRYIKQLADSEDFIKTSTMGSDIDLNKGNIFPLFNVDITDATFTSNATVSFDVLLSCLAVRDINKEDNQDKFYSNDNEIDNYNLTLSVLNKIWVKMHRDFIDNDITASDNPLLTQITYSDKNLLDGWEMTMQVEMPLREVSLC
mgnify:FL=1|tara:strand:+ start:2088 stop:2540 length:453 start_codon:yes stop_codon:yes gene_type:complete